MMAANPVAWVLVFHLAGMVFWIGGLFLALAAAGAAGGDDDAAARSQRARLAQKGMRSFAHPGAALMVVTGGLLFYLLPEVRLAAWLHAKLLLVAILIGMDIALTVQLRRMPEHELAPARLGMFHGAISLLFLLILVLVLVKPF
ncbi:MAG TPA: CopD family protein [Terriglobales bacterium]|nr:CopD family protein [Terriglobales bacterium]